MIYIAHRGNIEGKNTARENHPDYLIEALDQGYDVETDIRSVSSGLFFGHDEPQYPVTMDFIRSYGASIWWHAKDIAALSRLMSLDMNCFYHDTDDAVITSFGVIWTFPGKMLTSNSICVLPELNDEDPNDCLGICSDFIKKYRDQHA